MKGDSSEPRIAIVGGGLAGIAAAVALGKAGFLLDLYESNQRLGGRVGSFTDTLSGEQFDYCQHVGMACCTNLVHLIETLNQRSDWHLEDTLHFYSASGKHLPLKAAPLPAPLHMSSLLVRWPGLRISDRFHIGIALLKLMRLNDNDAALDDYAIKWLSAHQSKLAIDRFWNTILVSALGESIERVALRPARKVLLDGFARNRNAYKLLVPNRPLSELFDVEVQKWLTELNNVKLKLGMKVDFVERNHSDQRCCIRLNDGSSHTYDAVILCVPWYRIHKLLGIDETGNHNSDDPGSLQTSPITGIHTWWDKPWMKTPHAVLVDHLCQWVFAKNQSGDQENSRRADSMYYQIVISSSRHFSLKEPAKVEAALKDDLRNVFPLICNASMLQCKVVTDPRSVFSVTPESDRFRWSHDRLADQQIWLAGDWTETGWPATMEGAIRSGFLAAKSVANKFHHQFELPIADLKSTWLFRWLSGN